MGTLPGIISCLWKHLLLSFSCYYLQSSTRHYSLQPPTRIACTAIALGKMHSCPVAPEEAKDMLRPWNFNIWMYCSMTLVFRNLVILTLTKADTFFPAWWQEVQEHENWQQLVTAQLVTWRMWMYSKQADTHGKLILVLNCCQINFK